ELVKQLESPNGVVRDLVQRLIVERQDKECVPLLKKDNPSVLGRLHALSALAELNSLDRDQFLVSLSDRNSMLVAHAVRLSEPWLERSANSDVDPIWAKVERLGQSRSPVVQLQVACSVGVRADDKSGEVLSSILFRPASDPYIVGAALSSIRKENGSAVAERLPGDRDLPIEIVEKLMSAIVPMFADRRMVLCDLLTAASWGQADFGKKPTRRNMIKVASLLDALDRQAITVPELFPPLPPSAFFLNYEAVKRIFELAEKQAVDTKIPENDRLLAI